MYAPFSRIVSEMEFRVFHDIFCESYRIQRKAFAFDEYVSLVYEKFALHIIEIGVMNWMLFLVFMLLSLSGCESSPPPSLLSLTHRTATYSGQG